MIRLALTDDHPMVRVGIAQMLSTIDEVQLVGQWSSAKETLAGLETAMPQILLLDINLPDSQGDRFCLELKNKYPALLIICISSMDQTILVQEMLRAGAVGFVSKNANAEELETALHVALEGKTYLSPKIEKRLLQFRDLGTSYRLTRREVDVLKLVAAELTTALIAEKLFISEKTVESHRASIYQKLGVKNLAGLIREAIQRGYIS